jgi:hypothetical protein
MEVEQAVNDWITPLRADMVDSYISKGLKASGKYERDLEFRSVVSNSKVNITILGSDHTYYMENGRGPNKDQSPESIRAWVGWAGSTFLKKWVADKGLTTLSPYAVAWKIARKGIEVPNTNNPGGVVTDVLNKEKIAELIETVGAAYVDTMKLFFINRLKR